MSTMIPTSSDTLVFVVIVVLVVIVVRTDGGRAVGEVGSLGWTENADAIEEREGDAIEEREGDAIEERDGDATDVRDPAVDARVRPGRLIDSSDIVRGGKTGACDTTLARDRFRMVRELVDIDELRRSSWMDGASRRAVVVQSCNLPETCRSSPPKSPLVDRSLIFTLGLSSKCLVNANLWVVAKLRGDIITYKSWTTLYPVTISWNVNRSDTRQ